MKINLIKQHCLKTPECKNRTKDILGSIGLILFFVAFLLAVAIAAYLDLKEILSKSIALVSTILYFGSCGILAVVSLFKSLFKDT